jgi:lysozyme family protein
MFVFLKKLFGSDTVKVNTAPLAVQPQEKTTPLIMPEIKAHSHSDETKVEFVKQVPIEENVEPKLQSKVVIANGNPTKEEILASLLSVEGGYVNNPKDKGGETNFGITVAVANENITMLKSHYKWDGTMRGLTKQMATAIYEKMYWQASSLDTIYSISPLLADKIFDLSINCGRVRAGKWLQCALNALNRQQKDFKDIKVDGGIGSGTIGALNAFIKVRGKNNALSTIQMALIGQQANHYISISITNPDNEEFVYGWLQRCSRHIELYVGG